MSDETTTTDERDAQVLENFRYLARNADTANARAFWEMKVECILNPPAPEPVKRRRARKTAQS